jgi:hypothetical protein
LRSPFGPGIRKEFAFGAYQVVSDGTEEEGYKITGVYESKRKRKTTLFFQKHLLQIRKSPGKKQFYNIYLQKIVL